MARFCCPKVSWKLTKSCPKVAGKWPRDINTEMVTKVVPVRAVELSIGAFCTEFRCAQLCDNDTFESGLGDRPSGPNLGLRNEISYCKGLEFASKAKKCQGLAKSFLTYDSRCRNIAPVGWNVVSAQPA